MSGNGRRGTVLVVGGGISGITAAIESSEAGCDVVLVEKNPYLGGRVAQMNQYFPKMCPPSCGLEINLRRIRTSSSIRTLTLSEVEKISGEPGHYKVTVKRSPRGVNSKCTVCGECVAVCPKDRSSVFDFGMAKTKAIYMPYKMAYPVQYVIDADACPGSECGKCLEACQYGAIELDKDPETIELDVSAVVWATGWDPYDATQLEGLGFGKYKNVITSVMMERLASPDGPTHGKITRPSDEKEVETVAFVQCAGSRDENYLKHCSGVCCLGSLKQTRYVRDRYPDAEIFVFYIDIRAPGRLEDFYQMCQEDEKLHLVKGKVAKITEDSASGDVVLEAEDTMTGERIEQKVNLAVLATGLVPVKATVNFENGGGLDRDADGFLACEQSLSGMVAAGCAKRPVDVAACVRDATGAALKALQSCGE